MYLPVELGRLIEGPENRGCTVPPYVMSQKRSDQHQKQN